MSGYLAPDYMYGSATKLDGHVLAVRWHEPTDTYESIDLATVASNHLELPLDEPLDNHYQIWVGVDDEDSVFFVGNHHDNQDTPPTTTHMVVCNNVNAWTNPASWAAASTAHYDVASPNTNGVYTYHIFERASDGTLLHFLSRSPSTTESRGRDWLAFKRRAGVWSALVGSGDFATTETVSDGTANRVYINSVHVVPDGGGAGVDQVIVYGNWRTENTLVTSATSPFVLYSVHADFSAWRYYQTAGPGYGTQTMPITWANMTSAEIGVAPANSYSYQHSVYTDDSGNPSVIARDGAGPDYVRLTWDPTTGWGSAAVESHSGEIRDFRLQDTRWARIHTVERLAVRRVSDLRTAGVGGKVPTLGTNFSPGHDPVWLRERGVYCVGVPDGNTPLFWTFGNTARLRTA